MRWPRARRRGHPTSPEERQPPVRSRTLPVLHRHPTAPLYWPEFALWCGTTKTEDWHVRYRAEIAVYGHLHIPRTTEADGVRFEEVSLGYPREWRKRARGAVPMRRIVWPS